jgi:hypothetical protein
MIALVSLREWKPVGVAIDDGGLAIKRQKMFDDLAKKLPITRKEPEWGKLLFEELPHEEEGESMKVEFANTEEYWEFIRRFAP